jgi:hypothetical protein
MPVTVQYDPTYAIVAAARVVASHCESKVRKNEVELLGRKRKIVRFCAVGKTEGAEWPSLYAWERVMLVSIRHTSTTDVHGVWLGLNTADRYDGTEKELR